MKYYRVIEGTNNEDLSEKVSVAISMGWRPYGNLVIHDKYGSVKYKTMFYQAMIPDEQ